MRKFFGTLLIVAGVLALADFLIWGTVRTAGDSSHLLRPLLAADSNFPEYVSKLCFGLGMLVFGLYLLLLEGDMGRCPLSLIFMLNALALCFALLIAFTAGAQLPEKRDLWAGVASIVALLLTVSGMILLFFAASERPLGKAGLSIGSVLYVSSVAVGAVVFLNGIGGKAA